MKTIGINGFAYWASYLVNGDIDGLSEGDIDDAHTWAQENGVNVHDCLTAEDDGIGWVRVGGASTMGDCMYYTFSLRA